MSLPFASLVVHSLDALRGVAEELTGGRIGRVPRTPDGQRSTPGMACEAHAWPDLTTLPHGKVGVGHRPPSHPSHFPRANFRQLRATRRMGSHSARTATVMPS